MSNREINVEGLEKVYDWCKENLEEDDFDYNTIHNELDSGKVVGCFYGPKTLKDFRPWVMTREINVEFEDVMDWIVNAVYCARRLWYEREA